MKEEKVEGVSGRDLLVVAQRPFSQAPRPAVSRALAHTPLESPADRRPRATSPAEADVQSRYEPRAGPGAGQEFLKTFEGEWTVERNFYPPSGGAPRRATGECVQKMVQDGRFLESNFTFH